MLAPMNDASLRNDGAALCDMLLPKLLSGEVRVRPRFTEESM